MKLFEDTDNEDIRNLLNNIIRIGKVSTIDPAKGTARVFFDDDGYYDSTGKFKKIVTYELQVLQRNTLRNKDYAMPDVGEDVLCIFLPFGLVKGFILGSVYAGENTPPESTEDKRTVIFDDDTKVSYDRATHHMSVEIGETKITANRGFITIDAPRNISITAGNVVDVKANKLMVNGDLGASAGASGVISGASIATVKNGIITAIQ